MDNLRPNSAILLGVILLLIAQIPSPTGAQENLPSAQVARELLPYLHARSLLTYTQHELIDYIPELNNAVFDPNQADLPRILERVGQNVETFFKDYPNTTALEDVYLEREEPGGWNDAYLKRKYHYVVSARSGADELGLEEFRTNLKDELIETGELKGGYLLTSGHSSAPLLFHPRNSSGCEFKLLGRAKVPPQIYVIGFAQIAEKTRIFGTIALRGTEIAILEQGVIWVAPDSYQILRMRSELLVRRPDVGLERHTSIIDFKEIRFEAISRSLWLPREVQIIVKFDGYRFKNRHRYSQYRIFSVESHDGVKKRISPRSKAGSRGARPLVVGTPAKPRARQTARHLGLPIFSIRERNLQAL